MTKPDIATLSINTIRTLAMDAVQQANSGHPGMPMGCAPIAYVLWTQIMNYAPWDPEWINRDRFVLSAGHGSMLLYSMLHLTGYDLPLEQLKNFRQLSSNTAGHPEYWATPGIETTTGPLGQGFANGVGMAMAAKHLAAVYNEADYQIFDHTVYAICSDGDLMEGVASEAASLAGHLGLDNIIYLYDDNKISIEGDTALTFTEDVTARFDAYGWHVQTVADGNDIDSIEAAIHTAQSVEGKPHLVRVRTHIGYGSPNKQDSADAHGSPLGVDEVKRTKENLGWDPEKHFHIPAEVKAHFDVAVSDRLTAYQSWQGMYESYKKNRPELVASLEMRTRNRLPDQWNTGLPEFTTGDGKIATRKASGKTLQILAQNVPSLMGGSADLAPSTKTLIEASGDFAKDKFANRNLRFGVREHAMGSILNGMALQKGVRPYGATFLIFSDYMRPSIRLAALMEQPTIYVFTHDSVGLGEDGPTHQPIEQLASLRAIPNMLTLRPGDANEVVECWRIILQQTNRPAALILTRQGLPVLDRTRFAPASGVSKGGYVMRDSDDNPGVILLATGSEVPLALEAQASLEEEEISTRVVNMCSWELFEEQDPAYKQDVLPANITDRLVIEAARHTGWERYAGPNGRYITMEKFGVSAPGNEAMEHFGFSVENVTDTVKRMIA